MLARAFARQNEGKLCPICTKRVPYSNYERHRNECRMREDDPECLVLLHLTAEDKQRHARENFIDLASTCEFLKQEDDVPEHGHIALPSTSGLSDLVVNPVVEVSNPSPEEIETVSITTRKRSLRSSNRSTKENVHTQLHKSKTTTRKATSHTKVPTPSKDDSENVCDKNSEDVAEKRPRRSTRLPKPRNVPPLDNIRTQSVVVEQKRVREASVPASTGILQTPAIKRNTQRSAKRAIFPTDDIKNAQLSVKIETEESETISEGTSLALSEVHRKIVERLNKVADFYHSPTTSPVKNKLASTEENSNRKNALNDLTSLVATPAHGSAIAYPSYHLRFVIRILHKVFCYFFRETTESCVFWGNRLHLVSSFLDLSDKAQILLTRLMLRKRRWLTVARLSAKYCEEIAPNLEPFFGELLRSKLVESIAPEVVSLESALNLLQAPDLQTLCKKFKIDHRNGRIDLIKALQKNSKQKNVFGADVENAMLKKAVDLMGPTYRVHERIVRFFNAVLTLYAPVLMDSAACWDDANLVLPQHLLFTMLNVQTKKAKYPAPLPCTSHEILKVFNDYRSLQQYVKTKELEQEMAFVVSKGDFSKAVAICDEAYGQLQIRLNVDTHGDNLISLHSALPHSLRKYTDSWLFVRIVSHGVEALQRLKDYEKAVEMLEFLLATEALKPFCPDSRGVWWDRLALNLDAHLKEKSEALSVCQRGIVDDLVAPKEKLMLQDRALKLDRDSKFPVHITVPDPKKITINGIVLGKNLGDQRINHFMLPDSDGVYHNCSVEDVALNHYLTTLGYSEGIHTEGSIWHTLFGLMFYDIIFDHSISVAWLSELQDHPTDLNTREFYYNRQAAFDAALLLLELADDFSCCLPRMKAVFEEKKNEINSEISWSVFSSFEQIQYFLHCCKPAVLVKIFRKFITDNRNNRSGFPDLTVWNTVTRSVAVVEVKGPNDRLSTKQRLWLDFFNCNGVEAAVCHVLATNSKNLT